MVRLGEKHIANDRFAAKTDLAVSSIEFCQAIFDENYIRDDLGGGCPTRG
jgi:hypothetical protein